MVWVTYTSFIPELVNINETWEVPAVILEPNGYLIKDNHILSTGIPFVGSPYLVYPLAVFDEANPYSGNFVLPEPLRRTRKGAIYSFVDAWKMGWAAENCRLRFVYRCLRLGSQLQ